MCSPLAPPVPIIDSVEVAVLSLFKVELNISLLTNGGQSVQQYTVSWCLVCSCVCINYAIMGAVERLNAIPLCTVG